jgi:hypothetical protein
MCDFITFKQTKTLGGSLQQLIFQQQYDSVAGTGLLIALVF